MDLEVHLTRQHITNALPRLAEGLRKYLCIQAALAGGIDISKDKNLQRFYSGFYRVRRNKVWRRIYFDLLARFASSDKKMKLSFKNVLENLLEKTGRVEASFASKLVATLDPLQPVIDSVVLDNVGGRLSYAGEKQDRVQSCVQLHNSLSACYRKYLGSSDGKRLVSCFKRHYPKADITDVKMLDLVLWQTRTLNPKLTNKTSWSVACSD